MYIVLMQVFWINELNVREFSCRLGSKVVVDNDGDVSP